MKTYISFPGFCKCTTKKCALKYKGYLHTIFFAENFRVGVNTEDEIVCSKLVVNAIVPQTV